MTSFPSFGEETTAAEVASAFSEQIRGKHVLVVGVSPSSLSHPMCLAIASHSPAHLLLASRSPSKINAVIDSIKSSSSSSIPISSIILDLSSLTSIRSAAIRIKTLTEKLDIVINNAAVNPLTRQLNEDGMELHFATNYLGPFLLTNLLLPLLVKPSSGGGETRIINLTSQGHRISPIRFSDLSFEKLARELPVEERPPSGLPKMFFDEGVAWSPFVAYGQSKTGNVLFSVYLNTHLKEKGIRCYAVHPGSIWTGLARDLDEDAQNTIKSTGGNKWKSAEQGAAPALVAAFDPKLNEFNAERGVYLVECQFGKAVSFAVDEEVAERLWGVSEELVGERFSLE